MPNKSEYNIDDDFILNTKYIIDSLNKINNLNKGTSLNNIEYIDDDSDDENCENSIFIDKIDKILLKNDIE
jgi:hypothetical protein